MQCKMCKMEIDDEAKTCPYCRYEYWREEKLRKMYDINWKMILIVSIGLPTILVIGLLIGDLVEFLSH